MVRVLLIGLTSAPWETIAEEVEADLAMLARPGVELSYRCTGAGPAAVHSDADAEEADPVVVRTIVAPPAKDLTVSSSTARLTPESGSPGTCSRHL